MLFPFPISIFLIIVYENYNYSVAMHISSLASQTLSLPRESLAS